MASTNEFFPESDPILVKLTDSRIVVSRTIDNNNIHLDLDRNICGSNQDSLPQELLAADKGPDAYHRER